MKTTLQRFDELMGDDKESPLERLRFFCSLAMDGQDWLDVEPFFDALATQPQAPQGAVTGWQPIETAPKDGAAIMLGSSNGAWIGKWLPVYQSGFKPTNPWFSLMLNRDHMPTVQSADRWQPPTHWMPLPAAPETPEGKK